MFLCAALCGEARLQTVVDLVGTTATLECYADKDPGTAPCVVVCPGGSYCWLDYEHEGVEVAKWLQSQGFNAYVLRYRVAGWWAWATHYRLLFRGHQYPDPLVDAKAAVGYLRDSLHARHIGFMGFSAGGHLTMLAALNIPNIEWAAPIYPVVSMSEDCTHRRSRRALLGEYGKGNADLRDSLSIERRITAACPPVFLVNCVDDPVVDYRNSVLLDKALTERGIPHTYIQYKTGGHGFGVRKDKGTTECQQWPGEFLRWLNSISYKQ